MDPIVWFQNLPIITQIWFGCSIIVNLATTMDVMKHTELLFDITKFYYDDDSKLELWRIITSFCYCGGQLNEFNVLILLYTLMVHSSSYEKNPYPTSTNRRADYVFCLLFLITLTLLTYLIVDMNQNYIMNKIISIVGHQGQIHNIRMSLLYKGGGQGKLLKPYFTKNLVSSVMYLWSRRNPNHNININFIPIQGLYLPFAHLGIDLMLGNRINEVLHGLFVGHIYYWCVDIYPTITRGKHLLQTPQILIWLVGGGTDSDSDGPEADRIRRRQRALHHYGNRGGRGNRQPNINWTQAIREDRATSAHLAAKLGNIQQLRQIASASTNQRKTLFARDRNGWQPIHEAVRGGHIDIVEFLLSKEAMTILLNSSGGSGSDDDNDNNDNDEGDGGSDVNVDDVNINNNIIIQQVGIYLQSAKTNNRGNNGNGNGQNPIELAESTHGNNHPITLYLKQRMDEYNQNQQQSQQSQ